MITALDHDLVYAEQDPLVHMTHWHVKTVVDHNILVAICTTKAEAEYVVSAVNKAWWSATGQ